MARELAAGNLHSRWTLEPGGTPCCCSDLRWVEVEGCRRGELRWLYGGGGVSQGIEGRATNANSREVERGVVNDGAEDLEFGVVVRREVRSGFGLQSLDLDKGADQRPALQGGRREMRTRSALAPLSRRLLCSCSLTPRIVSLRRSTVRLAISAQSAC